MGRWGIALAVWLIVPGRADAEQCESRFGGTSVDATERYAYLEATLRTERRKGRIWNHAWGWGLLATAGAQAGAVALELDECEACLWVGAGKSILGVGSTFITNPVRFKTVAANPAPTCEDLALAEKRLEQAAENERIPIMRRIEGYGVNTAGLLYLGFAEHRWKKGTAGFVIGVIVGEIRLFTRPDGAMTGLRDYKMGRLDRRGNHRFAWSVAPLLSDEGFGFSVLGVF